MKDEAAAHNDSGTSLINYLVFKSVNDVTYTIHTAFRRCVFRSMEGGRIPPLDVVYLDPWREGVNYLANEDAEKQLFDEIRICNVQN